mmetsp:Transcript_20408/g.47975  ORF Transcript_20408/g.47975 Transcript_20408/m.47975 type:complete len:275 (-) Transcript_20408:85-909(-)
MVSTSTTTTGSVRRRKTTGSIRDPPPATTTTTTASWAISRNSGTGSIRPTTTVTFRNGKPCRTRSSDRFSRGTTKERRKAWGSPFPRASTRATKARLVLPPMETKAETTTAGWWTREDPSPTSQETMTNTTVPAAAAATTATTTKANGSRPLGSSSPPGSTERERATPSRSSRTSGAFRPGRPSWVSTPTRSAGSFRSSRSTAATRRGSSPRRRPGWSPSCSRTSPSRGGRTWWWTGVSGTPPGTRLTSGASDRGSGAAAEARPATTHRRRTSE